MGVVNASPESFSDAGRYDTLQRQLELAGQLVDRGADIVDVGGQSAITGRPEMSAEDEVGRVAPIVEWLCAHRPETLISVDTYKPRVVDEVLRAGAHIINDVSGLRSPQVAELCADAGAGLVIMHTKARPKERMQDPNAYQDVTAEVRDFLARKIEEAQALGVRRESIILDPGPDFAKTPHQTIALLRRIDELRAFGRPLLLALSRKDFLGAILQRPPLGREAGTLAAIAYLAAVPGSIVRVHNVEATLDTLQTIDVLSGRREIPVDYVLPEDIRQERHGSPG